MNGDSVEELFAQLQRKYQPQAITSAVVDALKEARLDHVINILYIQGCISGDYVHNAVQEVNEIPPNQENERLLGADE